MEKALKYADDPAEVASIKKEILALCRKGLPERPQEPVQPAPAPAAAAPVSVELHSDDEDEELEHENRDDNADEDEDEDDDIWSQPSLHSRWDQRSDDEETDAVGLPEEDAVNASGHM